MAHHPPHAPLLAVFPDTPALVAELATFVAKAQKDAIDKKGRFTIALSGGSLPAMLAGLTALPAGAVKWHHWHVFYVDERAVPLDHSDSNHRACTEALFSRVPLPAAQIYPIDASQLGDLEELADAYEKTLIHAFAQKDAARFPVFDLILLGMGPDGHTASLFPAHALLTEEDRWVAPLADAPKPPPERITLTYPVINHAARVVFVATGAGKADVLARVLDHPEEGLPAARVRPVSPGQLYWFVDEPAAARTVYPRSEIKL